MDAVDEIEPDTEGDILRHVVGECVYKGDLELETESLELLDTEYELEEVIVNDSTLDTDECADTVFDPFGDPLVVIHTVTEWDMLGDPVSLEDTELLLESDILALEVCREDTLAYVVLDPWDVKDPVAVSVIEPLDESLSYCDTDICDEYDGL